LSIVLDTHVWLWWLTPNSPLAEAERTALDAAAGRRELFISAISLWEVQVLHVKRRLQLPLALADWLEQAADPAMLTVLPLDVGVVIALDGLARRFHGDPADRLIVATARAHQFALATHDARIRRSRLVRIWKAD
jgi:PIN domain nuclease of toxin-antitoxin system